LWIGTDEGLSRYNGTQFTTFTTAEGLGSNSVQSILEDRAGSLWFGLGEWDGTGKGVSRYDGQQFTTFTTQEGLPHNSVWSMLEDSTGKLWFRTRGGGVIHTDGLVFQSLRQRDGLGNNIVQNILEDRRGNIWFTTDVGVTRYRPQKTSPAIDLVDVIADQRYGAISQLRLPSSQRLLAFEFEGASLYTPQDQIAYVYRLQGYQQQWQSTRARRMEYAALPPDEYLFEVKAVDRDLNYSAAISVALEIYDQPFASPVRLEAIQLNDVFASFYPAYTQHPLGSAKVVNDTPKKLETTLRLQLPGLMRQPFEMPLILAPQSAQKVALKAPLDAEIIKIKETRPVQAELSLELPTLSVKASPKPELMFYGAGTLRWDSVQRAAPLSPPPIRP
jgi:hypothetical protein